MTTSSIARWLIAALTAGGTLACGDVLAPDAMPAFEGGVAAAERGDWPEAVRMLCQAEKGGIRTPALYYDLGLACARDGREDAAIAWWEAYLVATPMPENWAPIRTNIRALEAAVMNKARVVYAHALAEAGQLPEDGDRAIAIRDIADCHARTGNMDFAVHLLDKLALPTDSGIDERNRRENHFMALYWCRDIAGMTAALERMPDDADRDRLLGQSVDWLIEDGQFESAHELASRAASPAGRERLASRIRDAQEEREEADESLSAQDAKAAAVEEWTREARGLTRAGRLAENVARLEKGEFLVTGPTTIRKTRAAEPGQLAGLAASVVGGVLRLRGLRSDQAWRVWHWANLALEQRRALQYRRAMGNYGRAAALNPESAWRNYCSRGDCEQSLGLNAAAIEDYTRAIVLEPNYSDAFIRRGHAKASLDDLQGALVDLDQALATNPFNGLAHYWRGLVCLRLKDYKRALADSDDAINSMGYASECHDLRAAVRRALGNEDGALEDYAEAIRINPREIAARLNRAELEAAHADCNAALADLDMAVKLDPGSATPLYRRGVIHADFEGEAAAVDDFTKAIEIDPHLLGAMTGRAEARRELGDKEGAFADYLAAAEAYWKAGDLDGARSALDQALKLDPASGDARMLRGVVEQTLGEFERALADYDAVISAGGPRFAPIYRELMRRRLGRPVDDGLARASSGWEEGFPRQAACFLTGQISLDKAVELARRADDLAGTRRRLTQLYYYSGMLSLLGEDFAKARSRFFYCLWLDVRDCDEFEFANAELARLDAPDG